MAERVIVRGQLCNRWNTRDLAGIVLEDGTVDYLARVLQQRVCKGKQQADVRMRYCATDQPLSLAEVEPHLKHLWKGTLYAHYEEHVRPAHGYPATEDYEPECFLGIGEELTFSVYKRDGPDVNNRFVEVTKAPIIGMTIYNIKLGSLLLEDAGKYLHMEFEMQD